MNQTTPLRTRPFLRWLIAILAGLAVVGIAAAAFVLSYPDLRDLAARGGASRRLRPLYPAMADGLVVVIVISLIVARHSRWWSRLVRRVLLLVVIAAIGAAAVQHDVWGDASLPRHWVRIGVAVAPWAILLVAVWLWLVMLFPQRTARRRPAVPPVTDREDLAETEVIDGSIIPGLDDPPSPSLNILVASKDRSTPFGPPPPASTMRSSPTPPGE